jgi:hypothetical protein
MEKKLRRGLASSVLVAALGFSAFLRMPGSEHVRAVQIVALLASGMGLGVALAHVKLLLGMKSKKDGAGS